MYSTQSEADGHPIIGHYVIGRRACHQKAMSCAPAAVGLFPSYVMAIIRRPRLQILPIAPASLAGSRTRTARFANAPAGGWRRPVVISRLFANPREYQLTVFNPAKLVRSLLAPTH